MSQGEELVATGTWLYDGTVPRTISIFRKLAAMASSRFDVIDDDRIDESRPIPETKDGFLYYCFPGKSGEHLDVEASRRGSMPNRGDP